MMPQNPRESALDMIIKILEEKKFSHIVLREELKKIEKKQDRSFVTRLVMGTVERAITLDYIIHLYSKVKIEKMKPFIRNLLRMSVYQIFYMENIPDSAVCNEAVKLVKKRRLAGLSGFVNGVLRTVARKKTEISFPGQDSAYGISVAYSCPMWLVEKMTGEFGFSPETCRMILRGNEQKAGVSVRVNLSKNSAENVTAQLESQGIEVCSGAYCREALFLKNIDSIEKVSSFQKGDIQPQDESSMLVGKVAKPEEGSFVLDVCGAPGGKSLHIADLLHGTGMVEVRDISRKKLDLIQENIDRTGFKNIRAALWDAVKPDERMREKADLVIADLPCSGLGVLGKKADIQYQLTPEGLEEIAALQRKILKAAAGYVKQGGVLIYSTCTINPKENIENALWFSEHFDFCLEPFHDTLPKALRSKDSKKGYLQLYQGIHNCDGFFIARFRRGKNGY